MGKKVRIQLAPGDWARLKALIANGNTPQKHVRRAQIVALAGFGIAPTRFSAAWVSASRRSGAGGRVHCGLRGRVVPRQDTPARQAAAWADLVMRVNEMTTAETPPARGMLRPVDTLMENTVARTSYPSAQPEIIDTANSEVVP